MPDDFALAGELPGGDMLPDNSLVVGRQRCAHASSNSGEHQEVSSMRRVHEAAAVFHEERGVAELLDVGQRFEERPGFGDGVVHQSLSVVCA